MFTYSFKCLCYAVVHEVRLWFSCIVFRDVSFRFVLFFTVLFLFSFILFCFVFANIIALLSRFVFANIIAFLFRFDFALTCCCFVWFRCCKSSNWFFVVYVVHTLRYVWFALWLCDAFRSFLFRYLYFYFVCFCFSFFVSFPSIPAYSVHGCVRADDATKLG